MGPTTNSSGSWSTAAWCWAVARTLSPLFDGSAFPTGLILDTVVLARGIHAQAAGRRQHAAAAHRRAAAAAQREDEAAAQHHSEAAAQREGIAAAERTTLQQARIERRYLPSFDEATSCDSGSPHRPVKRCGWTPMSRRLRGRGPLSAGSRLLADAASR